MTFALLFPAALAALAALLLPTLIHLARRSEERRTDFAALRWLRQKPKPRQRLRFDEWPLLALRLLLVALVALWLARPALQGGEDGTRWIVAVPGVAAEQAGGADDAERRWLAPGFPPIDEPTPAGSVPVASLLRQLDAEMPPGAPLTLLVPERLSGLDGERPRLSRQVEWRVGPGAIPMPGHAAPPPPPLTVRHAPDRASSLRYLRAAAIAWQPPGRPAVYSAASTDAPLPAAEAVLVWLAPGPLPPSVDAWIRRGGTALVDAATQVPASPLRIDEWRDSLGAPLVEGQPLGRGRLLRFVRPLTPTAMPQLLEPDFPERLRALFARPATPSSAYAADVAPLTGGRSYVPAARELQPWLALLIAALLGVERWFATRRSRRVAP